MALYKTVEQAQAELAAIDPSLAGKCEIREVKDMYGHGWHGGVKLRFEGTSIISTDASLGGRDGLYEVMPRIGGKNPAELFGPDVSEVVGDLTLVDAIKLAEAAVQGKEALRTALQEQERRKNEALRTVLQEQGHHI